jgi:hypothetical protein
MRSKPFVTYCVMFVLLSSFASATLDFTSVWSFQGSPVNGVRALNYECTNGLCDPLGTKISDQTSATNSITVSYTVPGPTNGYGTYWVADCFVPQSAAFSPTADGAGTFNFDFNKKSGCSSQIQSFSGPSTIAEGVAATFTIGAGSVFDSPTIAPFGIPTNSAIRNAHFSADTAVTFEVLDVNSTLISTQTSTQAIFLDSTNTAGFSFTPTFDQAGVYTVRARTAVTDCQCSSSSSQVSSRVFTVTNVNRAPSAVADVATVLEDGFVVVSVLANDNDVDGDVFNISAVTQGASGSVVNFGRNVTYTPTANFCGSDVFTYTATDNNSASDTASVAVTVTCVNDLPIASDDSVSMIEDGSVVIDVLANDSDVDGDALTVAGVSSAINGSLINNGGNVTYTPNPNFCGVDAFTYTASDGNGGNASASVGISIACVADAPVFGVLPNLTFVEDSGFQNNVIGLESLTTDADNRTDKLLFTIVNQTAPGIVSCIVDSSRFVDCTSFANQSGFSDVTVLVSDGGLNDSASFRVTLTAVNDAPDAQFIFSPAIPEVFDVVTFNASGSSDVDGDSLSFTWDFGDGSSGVGVVINHSFITPGDFAVRLTVSDGVLSDTQTRTVPVIGILNVTSVSCFNRIVADNNQSCSVLVRTNGRAVDAVDVDLIFNNGSSFGSCSTDSISGGCSAKHFHATPGNFTVSARASKAGFTNDTDAIPIVSYEVLAHRFTISDLSVFNDTAFTQLDTDYFRGEDFYVHFRVRDDNNNGSFTQSVITSATLVSPPGGRINLTQLNASGDFYRFSLKPIPLTHAFLGASQVFTFAFNFTDGTGGQKEVSLTIRNNPPVINSTIPSIITPSNASFSISLAPFEFDLEDSGSNLTWSVASVSNSSLFAASFLGKSLTVIPVAGQFGIGSLVVNLSDLDLDFDLQTIPVNITFVNTSVVNTTIPGNGTNGSSGGGSSNGSVSTGNVTAVDDAFITLEDSTVALSVLSNDLNTGNGSLFVSSVGVASNGVASGSSPNVTYVPNANFCGSDSFTYVASNGNESDSATASVSVTCVNDAPVATADSASTSVNTPVTINVLGNDNDVDGDTLSVELFTGAASGSVGISGTNFVYTPSAGFVGVDSFTYRARDGSVASNTVAVTVTVNQVNRAPVITSLPVTLLQQETDECCTAYRYDVEAFDADADSLTFSLLQAPSGMRINPVTGLITLADTRNFGSFVVIVQVTDGTFIVSQTFSLTVERARLDINPRKKFHITTIRTNQVAHSDIRPGERIFVDLGFENLGRRDTQHATIRVTEYELGISRKFGPFSGPDVGDAMSNGASIRIPDDARPGVYTLRITLSDTKGIRRVRHREFRII